MFILNPDPYLLPSYRISPFRTADIAFNHDLPNDDFIDEYFIERFNGREYKYYLNGRAALYDALKYYQLHRNDFVTILTTTGNFYISGCVTKEIEKFCKWSRNIEKDTKIILINHEFGYPFIGIDEVKKAGIPVIEDCAHSFFSKDKENKIGNVGDFVIYSFPKMFPIQIGGLMVSNSSDKYLEQRQLDPGLLRYIKNVLSFYIREKEDIVNTRINYYNILKSKFELLGFAERLELKEGTAPGVFMFKTSSRKLNLDLMKKYFYKNGIQCSVFYGEEAFFIPIHQALREKDLDYFFEVMKSYNQ